MKKQEMTLFEQRILQEGLVIHKKQRKSGKWFVELSRHNCIYYRAASSISLEDCLSTISRQMMVDAQRNKN